MSENVALFHFSSSARFSDRNILVALTIVDLARPHFMQLSYRIKRTFGPILYVVATEIDAVVAEYRDANCDFMVKMKELSPIFDYSELPTAHELYSKENAGKPGVFRWEHLLLKEYIKLSAKTYARRLLCRVCMRKCDPYGGEVFLECKNDDNFHLEGKHWQ